VNFASAKDASAQNVNYVVPAVHISQLLNAFRAGHGFAARHLPHREHNHMQLKVAPVDAVGVEASSALYQTSGGCKHGVFLAHLLPTSAFRFAKPPIDEKVFLIAVDGVQLDSFGMGRTDAFLNDPAPFESLMMSQASLNKPITVKVCKMGRISEHKVSMAWRKEYDKGIPYVSEPRFDQKMLDFEQFEGITLMQMTQNHVFSLVKQAQNEVGADDRWLLPESQLEPHVLISDLVKGSYAERILWPGMVVEKVNGHHISSLQDVRRHLAPQKGSPWTLETDRGVIFVAEYNASVVTAKNKATGTTRPVHHGHRKQESSPKTASFVTRNSKLAALSVSAAVRGRSPPIGWRTRLKGFQLLAAGRYPGS